MDYSEGSSIVVGTSFHSGKPLGDGSFIILFYFWIFFCWFFPYSLGFSRCISKARSDVNSIRIQLRCWGERRAVLQRCQLIIARQWIVYQLKALWGYLHIQAAHLHVDVAAMMNGLACATDVNGPCPNRRRRRRPIINGPSVTWRVTKRRPLTTAIVITRSLDFVYRHRSAAVAFKQIELSGIVVNMEVGKGPDEVDVFCFWLHRFQRKTLLENSCLKNKKKRKRVDNNNKKNSNFPFFFQCSSFFWKWHFFGSEEDGRWKKNRIKLNGGITAGLMSLSTIWSWGETLQSYSFLTVGFWMDSRLIVISTVNKQSLNQPKHQ